MHLRLLFAFLLVGAALLLPLACGFTVGPRGSRHANRRDAVVTASAGPEIYGDLLPDTFEIMERLRARDQSIRAVMPHAKLVELFNADSELESTEAGVDRAALVREYVQAAQSLGHTIPDSVAESLLFPPPPQQPASGQSTRHSVRL